MSQADSATKLHLQNKTLCVYLCVVALCLPPVADTTRVTAGETLILVAIHQQHQSTPNTDPGNC